MEISGERIPKGFHVPGVYGSLENNTPDGNKVSGHMAAK